MCGFLLAHEHSRLRSDSQSAECGDSHPQLHTGDLSADVNTPRGADELCIYLCSL